MFAATAVGRRRDNAVANLLAGLGLGFAQIGQPLRVVRFDWTRQGGGHRKLPRLDPRAVPKGCDGLLVPYWISDDLWDVNFAELRRRHPGLRIASLTGTWPTLPGTFAPPPHDAAAIAARRRENLAAVDLFLVVRAPAAPTTPVTPTALAGARVVEVGMGRLAELARGPKASTPLVVLDFLKAGWDEAAYSEAAGHLAALAARLPDLRVVVLGANRLESEMLPRGAQFVRLRAASLPFLRLAGLWAQAWAAVCHNETFGYSLVESRFCGTPVFSSRLAEQPEWQRPAALADLAGHLAAWGALGSAPRQAAADALAARYELEHSRFTCWASAARRIAEAFAGLGGV
jgi:hypothetical protein